MEYLIDILIDRHKKITIIDNKFLKSYRDLLKAEYSIVLDHLQSNVLYGDIIELESFIRKRINGNITEILDNFIEDYEKSTQDNKVIGLRRTLA